MKATVNSIRERLPSLKRPYDERAGVYPCRSFNLGRHTASYPHTDTCNLAQSWCSITPIGTFDARLGGHLILKELQLIVEFPASSTILIPSALITHSNTAVGEHERRYSLVQYAAGGLFRWVENGYMTDTEWMETATEGQLEQRKKEESERWREAAAMFMTIDELIV